MATEFPFKFDDGGNRFYYLPQKVTMPTESGKYWRGPWLGHYSLSWLSYIVYKDKNLYWLILAANNLTDPFQLKVGRDFRVLLPKYLPEVQYG